MKSQAHLRRSLFGILRRVLGLTPILVGRLLIICAAGARWELVVRRRVYSLLSLGWVLRAQDRYLHRAALPRWQSERRPKAKKITSSWLAKPVRSPSGIPTVEARRVRSRLVIGVTCGALVLVATVSSPATADLSSARSPVEGVDVVKNVEIPTRSGNVLRADLYRPIVHGSPVNRLPTVVTYFPYVKDDTTRFEVTAMKRFATAGYAGLLVDIAGTGASPGEFGFFSTREIADGRDVVEWAASQRFSNGRVGMWGYSYPGITAALVAATRPTHLKAVVPAASFNDAYRDLAYPGGIRASQDAALLPFIAGQALARARPGTDPALALKALLDPAASARGVLTVAEAAQHTFYDDYWKERALDGRIQKIQVPALLWGGWSDVYPRGTLLNYAAIGSTYKRLVMGPWGHLAGVSGEPLTLFLDESLHWFDTFLRHTPGASAAKAATGTRLFAVDWTSKQKYAGTWPGHFMDASSWPNTQTTTLSLCSGESHNPSAEAPWPVQGELAKACTTSGSLPVLHVPLDVTGGGSIAHDAYANPNANEAWDDKDQRLSLDSVALLSAPLGKTTTLTGAMIADLWATTSTPDADWVVRVVDVGPDRTRVLAPGWLRATRRAEDPRRGYLWHPHSHDEPIVAGQPYRLRIEVWPTSYTVPAGHRLGLLIRAGDTLKVLPGSASGISQVLTGPLTPSKLTFSVRSNPRPREYEH